MQSCDAIYEEVGAPVGEVQIKKNECYEDYVLKTAPDTSTKKRSTKKRSQRGQKHVVLGVTLAILVFALAAVAGITGYALVELFRMKSAMLKMSATLESRILHISSNTSEAIKALDAKLQVQISTCQSLNSSISEMAVDIDTRILQISRDMALQTATSISALQQQFTQNDSALEAKLRHLNTSISVINFILSLSSNSCDTLPTSSPAGYYNFTSANGSLLHQYCPPISTRCGLPGRWQSVADLDMTNSTHQCYSPLQQHTYSNKSLCVRSSGRSGSGCTSVQLSTTAAYRSVCGLVRAYQFGTPEAFLYFESSVDDTYVDGVSITHGSPRQHIWTFAAATSENSNHTGCPCMGGRDRRPRFVKNDYFCDSGTSNNTGFEFYGDNPLWNGAGCGPTSSCCDFNDPPWFYKELPQYTYDDIELRLCNSYRQHNEDIALQKIEIFVK